MDNQELSRTLADIKDSISVIQVDIASIKTSINKLPTFEQVKELRDKLETIENNLPDNEEND